MGRLLNIKDTASYLNVSQDTLRKWDKANKLKPLKTAGGHRRYDTDTLDEFIGRNKTFDEFIQDAWDWIEPYFVAQQICKESIEALRQNFTNRMKIPHTAKSNYK